MRNSILPGLRQQGILRPEHLLDLYGTLNGIHHTGKFRQNAIPGSPHYPASILLDETSHDLFERVQSPDGPSSSSPMRRL